VLFYGSQFHVFLKLLKRCSKNNLYKYSYKVAEYLPTIQVFYPVPSLMFSSLPTLRSDASSPTRLGGDYCGCRQGVDVVFGICGSPRRFGASGGARWRRACEWRRGGKPPGVRRSRRARVMQGVAEVMGGRRRGRDWRRFVRGT